MFRNFALSLLVAGALGGVASAQVNISGNLSDATTGPLQGGLVYHVVGSISVQAGDSLTIEPGAILKFPTLGTFNVRGELLCGGAGGSVLFTSLEDDSAGGDTPGDGPSVGQAGQWRGILVFSTSPGAVWQGVEVRYGGQAGFAGMRSSDAGMSLQNVTIRDCAQIGLDLGGVPTGTTLTGCTFRDNGTYGITNAALDDVPGFVGNTATGNGTTDLIRVTTAPLLDPDVTLDPVNFTAGALLINTSVTIANGSRLTLQPGTVIKWESQFLALQARGDLHSLGTNMEPVVLTSFADDDIAGDSNKDGFSQGVPGGWRGIQHFNTSTDTRLQDTILRFGGQAGFAGVTLAPSGMQLNRVTIENCESHALRFPGVETTNTSVTGCELIDNGGRAVENLNIMDVPKFLANAASGNALGNYQSVASTAISADLVLGPQNILNEALVISGGITIPTGLALEMLPGTVIKWNGFTSTVMVRGRLNVQGEEASRVVWTTIEDDSIAGDTNQDGTATAPIPGAWRGVLTFSTMLPSTLEHFELRYAGQAGFSAVNNAQDNLVLRDVHVLNCQTDAFTLGDLAAGARNLCAVEAGGYGYDLAGGSFDLERTTAYGCGLGGYRMFAAFQGKVIDSIAWANQGLPFENAQPGQVMFSNGDPALAGIDGNLFVDPQFIDAPSDLNLAFGSPCVDAGDPNSQLDEDGTRADMGCGSADQCAGRTYCVGKLNSQGCVPFCELEGRASASSVEPFWIRARDVVAGQNGIFFYSLAGPSDAPFQGGTLCVSLPIVRTPVQASGGSSGCEGVFEQDFNAWIQSGIDPALIPGIRVWGQHWYRDPASPSFTGLSDAVEFLICE